MNEQDIQAFIRAFDDFMKHADVEELYHEGRKVYANYVKEGIEQKAAELQITVDYYIQEFM